MLNTPPKALGIKTDNIDSTNKGSLNRPKFSLLLFGLFLLFSGCSLLTKSQLSSIQVYAIATGEYTQYPGQLVRDYVAAQNRVFLLSSPLISQPDQAAKRVFTHHHDKTAIVEEAEKLDLSFELLKEYAHSLEILSTPDYFEKTLANMENTGTHLDHLVNQYNERFNKAIPGGLGSLIYSSLITVGSRFMDRRRDQILKEFITLGKPMIKEITQTTKGFLKEEVAEEWIRGMDLELQSTHAGLRRQILVDTLNFSSNTFQIIQLDTEVAELYEAIEGLKILNQSLIMSIDELYLAHEALYQNVQQKRKLATIVGEVASFAGEVQGIIDLYKNFSPEKETGNYE